MRRTESLRRVSGCYSRTRPYGLILFMAHKAVNVEVNTHCSWLCHLWVSSGKLIKPKAPIKCFDNRASKDQEQNGSESLFAHEPVQTWSFDQDVI